jgi:rhodanese-related sulfurtransferase
MSNDGDEISYEALREAMSDNAVALIDVREPHEYAAGTPPGAVNRPLSSFNPAELPRDKPVVLICRSGGRSMNALNRSRQAGFADARHFRGGVIGWSQSGGELV